MEESDFLMEKIPPALVAKALEVPESTIYSWLKSGEISADQSLSGRWSVTVKACHDLIDKQSRKVDKEEIKRRFDAAVRERLATRKDEPCAV